MVSKLLWAAILIAVGSTAQVAPPAPVPRTGQTLSYRAGDDGDLRKGIPWPSPRFTDQGDGTVADNLTGLVWLKDANCMATAYASADPDGVVGDGYVTWQRALDFVKGINAGTYSACAAGYTDWRLPNVKELRSLVDYSRFSPALPTGHPFLHVTSYWSSTSYANDPTSAWTIWLLSFGDNGAEYSIDKPSTYAAWPVRTGHTANAPAPLPQTGQTTCYDTAGTVVGCAGTGQEGETRAGVAWPNPRFMVGSGTEEGCVTDNLTGLVWSRSPESATMTWYAALTYASNFSLCGQTDWRLPNVNEIESLLNAEESLIAPWLQGQGFTNVQPGAYWSSTTSVCLTGCTGWAWVVGIDRGGVGAAPKGESLHVWLVRGGASASLGTSDLSLTNSDSPDPVLVGRDVTYTMTVTNSGPDVATAVSLTDRVQVPPALAFISVTSTKGTCQTQLPTITCLIGDMGVGEVVTATIVLRPTEVGTSCNTAGVAGATDDPQRSNDAATQCTTVQSTIPQTVLTVNINPAGGGTVTGTGIACPGDCTEVFASAQSVTLSASQTAGYAFIGWAGCDVANGNQCTVTMNSNKSVTAAFTSDAYTVTVQKAGSATGTVTSSPSGIDCGNTCSGSFARDAQVTLTAAAASGAVFAGWGGDCAGAGTCVLTMGGSHTVSATFNLAPTFDFAPVTPASAQVRAGQAAQFSLTINPQNGAFANAISFACAAGVPLLAACSFSPPSVTPGSSPASSTLTVSTTSPSAARPAISPLAAWLAAPFVLLGTVICDRRRRRLGLILLPILAVPSLAGLFACGGSTPALRQSGTPPGSYTITVQATSGTTSRSTSVVVVVQ